MEWIQYMDLIQVVEPVSRVLVPGSMKVVRSEKGCHVGEKRQFELSGIIS